MNPPSASTLVFDPILPIPVIVVIGALLALATVPVYWRSGATLGVGRSLLLMAFRLAGIALVVLLLLQPSRLKLLPPLTKNRVTLVGLDTSLSMNQRDAGNETRFDAAKKLLQDSGVVAANGTSIDAHLRLFSFDSDARPLLLSIFDLVPTGKITLFQKSVTAMLATPAGDETVNAVILLTDGHDFEMVNPVKTGMAAHTRGTPIYAVALGRQGDVRDVAVHITAFQPYCYVKQKAHISATLRVVGCELENLNVELLRQGKVIQTRQLNARQLQEIPVEFEITEPETGQYEYEVRVQPLENENDTTNNSAITYLNVIDQQIRVLVLEGDPYWDMTFLQRSLMRNDKFDVDALIRYGDNHVRAIRKSTGLGELHMPKTVEELAVYDVVILGRAVDTLPDGASLPKLVDEYVKSGRGSAIFSRGKAFGNPTSDLEPILWSEPVHDHVRLVPTAEGRSLSPFQVLSDGEGGLDALPELVDGARPKEIPPLTSVLAVSTNRDNGDQAPAILHRRYGQGQILSIGVEGLWRWGMNAKIQRADSPFDRFWDQIILYLLAGRDFIPNRQYSFRPNSANILLGEKVYFRLSQRKHDPQLRSVPVTVSFNESEVGRTTLTLDSSGSERYLAEFLPNRVGRYRAVVSLPNGETQESRFIVYNQNLEETEVATDALYLRRLCEASGGRLLEPEELPKLIKELGAATSDQAPKSVLRPVWNRAWVFYLIGLLLGLDWFLRRRWGLC